VPKDYAPDAVKDECRDYFFKEKYQGLKKLSKKGQHPRKKHEPPWVSKQGLQMEQRRRRCYHMLHILEEELVAEIKREMTLNKLVRMVLAEIKGAKRSKVYWCDTWTASPYRREHHLSGCNNQRKVRDGR